MTSDALLDGRLKLRHIRFALVIAECGTLVRAAEALHVTQPVVTRALAELERLLGHEVFVRGAKGVTPTEFGEGFLRKASMVVANLRDVQRDIDKQAQGLQGTIVIGNHLSGSMILLPQAVVNTKQTSPDISFIIREGPPNQLVELLRSGKVDLVVGRLSEQFLDRDFRLEELYREPVRIIVRTDHPLAQRSGLTLHDLQHHDWILPLQQTSLRGEIEKCFAFERLPVPNAPIECTSAVMIREIVRSSNTIAVAPHQLLAHADPHIVSLPVNLNVQQSVGVITRAGQNPFPALRRFLAELRRQGDLISKATSDEELPGSVEPH